MRKILSAPECLGLRFESRLIRKQPSTDEIKRLSEVEKQKRKQHQSRRRDIVEEYASTNEWGMNKMSR